MTDPGRSKQRLGSILKSKGSDPVKPFATMKRLRCGSMIPRSYGTGKVYLLCWWYIANNFGNHINFHLLPQIRTRSHSVIGQSR